MIGCDCGGGHDEGKAGAGGAHVPLQRLTSTCRNVVALVNPYTVHIVINARPSPNILFIQRVRAASAPTISAVLVHTVRRRCMKSDCMGLFPIP